MNQKGFTLVELLIVIGIIGILSVIAIPNFMKFQAKAKQTEAKINLSGLYTAEKAFYAEYGSYHSALGTIGFSVDGNRRFYAVGFPAATGVALPNGVTNQFTLCGGVQQAAADSHFCASSNVARATNAVTAGITPPAGGQTFTAASEGLITDSGNTVDTWTMDQTRQLLNTINGI